MTARLKHDGPWESPQPFSKRSLAHPGSRSKAPLPSCRISSIPKTEHASGIPPMHALSNACDPILLFWQPHLSGGNKWLAMSAAHKMHSSVIVQPSACRPQQLQRTFQCHHRRTLCARYSDASGQSVLRVSSHTAVKSSRLYSRAECIPRLLD